MEREIFTHTDAHAILTIHIPFTLKQDRLIWLPDAKGVFFVKSIYKVAFNHPTSNDQSQTHWSKQWKAKFPKRLKLLIWRIGANAIPTKANLQRRIPYIDQTCSLCNSGEETSTHLFFECNFARALWAAACWGLKTDAASINSNEDIIKIIVTPLKSPVPAHKQWYISLNIALIVDEIWQTRNLIQFQDGKTDVLKAKQNVQSKFLEILKVLTPAIQPPTEQVTVRWTPPPQGWINVNVDAALNSSRSALAVVAMDHRGEVLFLRGVRHYLCRPAQAEAEALLWAVKLAIQEKWSVVIFEGDAKICIDALSNSELIPDWHSATTICNICSLASHFTDVKFSWVWRLGNSAAMKLLNLP
nr:uncharacterized protein LOC112004387 [Quercus suber]